MFYKQQHKPKPFLFLLLMLLSTISFAQTGTFDVRFLIDSVDCNNAKLYLDLQVRADDPGKEFYLSGQNYRFSFDRDVLANPQIVSELDVAGYIPSGSGTLGFSFYSPHTLTGSLDTIVSYNLELQGGDGIYVEATNYIPVGRMSLDILDFNAIIRLRFHRDIPRDFPNLFIGQKYNDELIPTIEGSYLDYFHDFSEICNNNAPVTINDTGTAEYGESISVCLLDNDTDPEGKLDPGTLILLSTPPTSEGTVDLDTNTGCITFMPSEGFSGTVTSFEYEICDIGKYIPAYQGDANPSPISLPDPGNADILVTPSACNTATIQLTIRPDPSTGIADNNVTLFQLNTFPNPADDQLYVSYTLPQQARVSMAIWNTLGQTLIKSEQETLTFGKHTKSLNTSDLKTGTYLLVLTINKKTATRLVHIK